MAGRPRKRIRSLAGAALVVGLVQPGLAQQPAGASQAERGRELYEQYCQTCHGPDMVNPGTASSDLRRFPPEARNRFNDSVLNGKAPGMPSWRGLVTAEELDLLWVYVLAGRVR